MNQRINLSNTGGFPFTQGTLAFMQESYRNCLAALASLCGDKVIVTGVVVSAGNATPGWIVYNNELIPFLGGAVTTGVVVVETSQSLVYEDNIARPALFTKVAQFGQPATFDFSELVRLDTLKTINQTLADLVADFNTHTHSYNDLTNLPYGKIVYAATRQIGNISATDSTYIESIPDQGNNNYLVIGTMRGNSANPALDNDISFVITAKQPDQFTICIREYEPATQDLTFEYIIVKAQ